jgi:hypothetical protein
LYFKQNPEINGITVVSETNFNYGGTLPVSVVAAKACPKGVIAWAKLQKQLDKQSNERMKVN